MGRVEPDGCDVFPQKGRVMVGLLFVAGMICQWLAIGAAGDLPAPQAVGPQDQSRWVRWAVPLPKQISIDRMVELPAAEVRLRLRAGAGEIEKNAARGLIDLFRSRANADLRTGTFEVLMGVCDAQGRLEDVSYPEVASLLNRLPNREQAYAIRSMESRRLVLLALDERGVYYAAQTLRQILEGQFSLGRVRMPLATITDWPDLSERGEWGGNVVDEIPWMAGLKMNLVEAHVTLKVGPDGRGIAKTNPERVELARLNALKHVPIITHLDQLDESGIYTLFPNLKGKGKSAQHSAYPEVKVPCLSQPKLFDILSDWMICLAGQKGVNDICAWLTEHELQCECANCRRCGQYVLETRAIVKAWEQARRVYPNLNLRILLTQGSYSTNDQVVAEIPPAVGVTYYHGGRTYDSSRDAMIYPSLEAFAARGRWLGCYPQLTASWRIVCPWSGPQFIRYRMTEFANKKLQCVCGYATPSNRAYDFNVTAAAEWSWNAKGRNEHEFAAAWATRRGMKDPDAVADWAVLLGPVGWDVYGSGIPYPHFFGNVAEIVSKHWRPKLGEGVYRYFPSVEHMENDLAICRRAMEIARRVDSPLLIAETRTIEGFVGMVRHLYDIQRITAAKPPIPESHRMELQNAVAGLARAQAQATGGLRQWEVTVGGNFWKGRFVDTLNVIDQTAMSVAGATERYGIGNTVRANLPTAIGKWATEDFAKDEQITKMWEVTSSVKSPGRYEVAFTHDSGWWGLTIHRVALASAPAGHGGSLAEIIADTHKGVAGHENSMNAYTLDLPKYDATRRYFVVAIIKGTSSRGKPANRQGCNGTVRMRNLISAPQ